MQVEAPLRRAAPFSSSGLEEAADHLLQRLHCDDLRARLWRDVCMLGREYAATVPGVRRLERSCIREGFAQYTKAGLACDPCSLWGPCPCKSHTAVVFVPYHQRYLVEVLC